MAFLQNMSNILKGYNVSTTRRYVPPFRVINDTQWGQNIFGVICFHKFVSYRRYINPDYVL